MHRHHREKLDDIRARRLAAADEIMAIRDKTAYDAPPETIQEGKHSAEMRSDIAAMDGGIGEVWAATSFLASATGG